MPKTLFGAPPLELTHGAVPELLPAAPRFLRVAGDARPADEKLDANESSESLSESSEAPRETSSRSREQRRKFERVVRQFRADLYRYAFWLSRDAAVADDLVQEALMRGWKSLHHLRDERLAKQWLLTIVRREHARLYERKRLETVDIDQVKGADEVLATRPEDPDVARLRRAILDLAPEYREPLVLQVLLGHGTSDIARLLGIRQGAVLTRLFRARKKLAAALVVEEL